MNPIELPMRDPTTPALAPRSATTHGAHHPLIIAVHWLTLAAILVGVAAILLRELTESRALRMELLNLHRSVGLLVLMAAAARMAALTQVDRPMHDTPRPMRVLATLSHGALYLLLLVLPMLGWALTSARGQAARLFDVIPLPPLMASNPDLADTLADYHEWAAWVLLVLVIAHAGAALWHHHVRRDQVLSSMLPKRRSAG